MAPIDPPDLDGAPAEMKELWGAIERFSSLASAASAEAFEWDEICVKDDSQFNRRAYVRAAFAWVEATTYGIRQFLLAAHQAGIVSLDWPQVSVLSETAANVKEKDGTVHTRGFFLRQIDGLRVTFSLTAAAFQHKLEIDYGADEWKCLEHGFKVRDRLVHPKSAEDYVVADDELSDIRLGTMWFMHAVKEFYRMTDPPRWGLGARVGFMGIRFVVGGQQLATDVEYVGLVEEAGSDRMIDVKLTGPISYAMFIPWTERKTLEVDIIADPSYTDATGGHPVYLPKKLDYRGRATVLKAIQHPRVGGAGAGQAHVSSGPGETMFEVHLQLLD